jgi:hypothetical protein
MFLPPAWPEHHPAWVNPVRAGPAVTRCTRLGSPRGRKPPRLVFALVLPFLGVLVYLIARGGKMAGRVDRHDQVQDDALRTYVRQPGR